MSVLYRPVGWNQNKAFYDVIVAAAVVIYITAFIHIAPKFDAAPPLDEAVVRMRAFGTCAFLMLTIILCIGPLARIDRRFLPLLYNRRHFGVMTCAVALTHATYVLGWYFAFSPVDPYVALLSSNSSYGRVAGFPFELFGVAALTILIILAATSHDFWLSFLRPPMWKAVHMGLYGAYACLVAHVTLGAFMASQGPVLAIVFGICVAGVLTVHILAARLGARDERNADSIQTPWVSVGDVGLIGDGRAKIVRLADAESIAVFLHEGRLSAIANTCAHQNGPLGEGRIIDGCVTCPWHGFQYRLEDGCAPPPFTEKLATYRLKLEGRALFVDPRPNPPGTLIEPIPIPETLA